MPEQRPDSPGTPDSPGSPERHGGAPRAGHGEWGEWGQNEPGGAPSSPVPPPPPPPGGGFYPGARRPRQFNPLTAVLIAVLVFAVVAGVVLVMRFTSSSSTPTASSGAGSTPTSGAPGGSFGGGSLGGGNLGGGSLGGGSLGGGSLGGGNLGGGGLGLGGGGGSGSGSHTLLMAGRVASVSSTSISFGSQGRTMTASITSATQFDGQAKSTSAIKAGDEITAVISSNGSSNVVQKLFDPAQMP